MKRFATTLIILTVAMIIAVMASTTMAFAGDKVVCKQSFDKFEGLAKDNFYGMGNIGWWQVEDITVAGGKNVNAEVIQDGDHFFIIVDGMGRAEVKPVEGRFFDCAMSATNGLDKGSEFVMANGTKWVALDSAAGKFSEGSPIMMVYDQQAKVNRMFSINDNWSVAVAEIGDHAGMPLIAAAIGL